MLLVQGGDPDSRTAQPGQYLGEGELPYSIPAEIKPQFYHKRGALAAARESDNVNPEKKSSSTQFYIVHGTNLTEEDLNTIEQKKNDLLFTRKLEEIINPSNSLSIAVKTDSAIEIAKKHQQKNQFKFSSNQRKTYLHSGGVPRLDQNYTVFGEVVEGMEVVDKIANLQTDGNDRPIEDIKFTITIK
ncbi:MAG: peptidylprolyl isomerase [Chloroflexia bacterium]|nr:peptidylprolyl isomerase [Chloroflexia bacterium]